jgi:coenzyme F420-0:L-glutamate ligase / coenzyme F420-1:gamma-L-glutamate ligase
LPWELQVAPVKGLKRVVPGDDLGRIIVEGIHENGIGLRDGDVVVVTHKVVSKSEGRLARLSDVNPGRRARSIALELDKDPRIVEVVLRESRRVVRKGHGILITETPHGFVCANSGVDQSNVEEGVLVLLPSDPDGSARRLRRQLESSTKKRLAVVITDTFGRPWRHGQTDVAIGCSGISPMDDGLLGKKDPFGYVLRVSRPAIVDEIAGASELVMKKLSMVPVVVVRGLVYARGDEGVRGMVLERGLDLFR